jgi:hypothetical protein
VLLKIIFFISLKSTKITSKIQISNFGQNVRKYQRGNPKMTIPKNWQQDEAKQSKNTAQYVLDTTM